MKAIVFIKPVPDTEARIVATGDQSAIDYSQTNIVINPYDEFAIEESIKLKEAGKLSEVVLCAFTSPNQKEVVIKGLAMGADRGLIVDSTGLEQLSSLGIAKILAGVVKAENPQLILGGKQAIDDDNMHVLAMLAEVLDLPHVNVVAKMELGSDSVKVEREVENGQVEVYDIKLPCVLGAHKSLNKPRYAPLPGIMKARKKPFDIKKPEDFGVDSAQLKGNVKARATKFQPPPEKPHGKVFKDEPLEVMVEKVVNLLRSEAKVI